MIEVNGVTYHFKKGEANISAKEQQKIMAKFFTTIKLFFIDNGS